MFSKNVPNILDTLCLRSLGAKKNVENKFLSDKWENDKYLHKKVVSVINIAGKVY